MQRSSSENSTDPSTPVYRLKDLIATKYRHTNYDMACSLVARWLSFETKTAVNVDDIKFLCEAKLAEGTFLSKNAAFALKNLFWLQSIAELYTFPKTIPMEFLYDQDN